MQRSGHAAWPMSSPALPWLVSSAGRGGGCMHASPAWAVVVSDRWGGVEGVPHPTKDSRPRHPLTTGTHTTLPGPQPGGRSSDSLDLTDTHPMPRPTPHSASCPRARLYQCDVAGRTAWRGEQALRIFLTNAAGWQPPTTGRARCPAGMGAAIAPGLLCVDLTLAPLHALTGWQGLGQIMLPQPILALAAVVAAAGTTSPKHAHMASLTLPAHSQQVLHRLEGVLDLTAAQLDESARLGQHAFKAWATCPRPCLQVRGPSFMWRGTEAGRKHRSAACEMGCREGCGGKRAPSFSRLHASGAHQTLAAHSYNSSGHPRQHVTTSQQPIQHIQTNLLICTHSGGQEGNTGLGVSE